MRREIKFRAWDKSLNMMIYSNEQSGHIEYDTNPVNAINIMLNEDDYNLEFMQYTGLKDKNGKEIYEGDILLAKYAGLEDAYYEVTFKDGSFIAVEKGCKYPDLLIDISKDSVVISNIYENHELLEDEHDR